MSTDDIPANHPRAASLKMRAAIEEGVDSGIVAKAGPIAHGRGEAFDYLIGEATLECVKDDIYRAAALLLCAKYPVISVNGNTAVLATSQLIELARVVPAKLEVNVFYGRTQEREKKIADLLMSYGATEILGVSADSKVPNLHSARQIVDREGIAKADVVLVPLEDGDRTKALIDWGKKVISIDLNPLSRTARDATINICDHVVRALELLTQSILKLKGDTNKISSLIAEIDSSTSNAKVVRTIADRLSLLADECD